MAKFRTMLAAALASLALAALALGCGRPRTSAPAASPAGPPDARAAPAPGEVVPDRPTPPISTLALRRKFPAGAGASALAVRGGLVTFEGSTTTLYSLNDDFPLQQTRFSTLFGEDVIDGAVSLVDGLLLARGARGWLRAVDAASLKPRWRVALESPPLVADFTPWIVSAGGVIVLQTSLIKAASDHPEVEPHDLDGQPPPPEPVHHALFGVSPSDGRVLWSLPLGQYNEGRLTAAGDRVAFFGSDGFVSVVAARDGRVVSTGRAQRFSQVADGSLFLEGGERFVALAASLPEPTLAVFDAATGAQLFERKLRDQGVVEALAIRDQTLFLSFSGTNPAGEVDTSFVEALELPSGRSRWRFQRPVLRNSSGGQMFFDDALIVCGGGGFVSAHEPSSGALLWKWSFASCPVVGRPDRRSPAVLLSRDPDGNVLLFARGEPSPPFEGLVRGVALVNQVRTAGVLIEVDGQSTRSGPGGHFALPVHTPGTLIVSASSHGARGASEVSLDYPGAVAEVELQLWR